MINKKREKRRLLDVLPEVITALNETIKGYPELEKRAQHNLLKNLQSGVTFPNGIIMTPIEQIWIDYSVQRDIKHKHVAKILDRFDPRICMPAAGVRIAGDESDRIYVYDGQHRLVVLALLGIKQVPICVVETAELTFPAKAFEICNDSGIAKASKGDIHRTLLYRWEHGNDLDKDDPKVKNAKKMQSVFDECDIDLEDKRLRKSEALKGDSPHFFSHFLYAEKGIAEGREVLKNILSAMKTVYKDEEEIDQGVYIGLLEMVKRARVDHMLDELPEGWMIDLLKVVKSALGTAEHTHKISQAQWQHTRGTSWDAPVAMCNVLREVFKLKASEELKQKIHPPFVANVNVGILDGNLHPQFRFLA